MHSRSVLGLALAGRHIRLGFRGDAVLLVQPLAEIDELAALAAERKYLVPFLHRGLLAGGTGLGPHSVHRPRAPRRASRYPGDTPSSVAAASRSPARRPSAATIASASAISTTSRSGRGVPTSAPATRVDTIDADSSCASAASTSMRSISFSSSRMLPGHGYATIRASAPADRRGGVPFGVCFFRMCLSCRGL